MGSSVVEHVSFQGFLFWTFFFFLGQMGSFIYGAFIGLGGDSSIVEDKNRVVLLFLLSLLSIIFFLFLLGVGYMAYNPWHPWILLGQHHVSTL